MSRWWLGIGAPGWVERSGRADVASGSALLWPRLGAVPGHLRRSGLLLVVACAVALSGCAVAGADPTVLTPSSPSAPALVPSDGVTLASLGFQHGPAGFSLPRGLQITLRVDQSNVVTLVVPADQGELLGGYLRAHLPGLGWTITADSPDALLATGEQWDAALTTNSQAAALTLRRQGTVDK